MDSSNLLDANVSHVTVEKRKVALSQLSKLSLISIGVSLASILLGILILVYSRGAGFPIITGAPVWSGATFLLSGILGHLASKSDVHYGYFPPPRVRCLLLSHYIICVSCMSVCGICFGYSIAGASVCTADDELQCGENVQTEFILNILSIVVSVFMLTIAIVGCIFFCVYRKLLGLYRPVDMLYQKRINDLESRIRTLENPNMQGQQQGFGGQYGYNSFNTTTAPPPVYSKE